MEYPFIFGTAGHIDHGKTALVRAMTGVDCDRLDEEKRRGITIELGFAALTLASGRTVSIIDVPGHERFIRQMAAGAAGMDAAMLVIAANEGVMPQTREHLDILDILGVKFGLVALTKKDTVDDETLELAMMEAVEVTQGTCLENAPIIPVSSPSGEGIPRILEEIERILDKIPPRKGFGAFFLPVDRVFSKKGMGSVVTGTSYQGTVSVGDEVVIMPSGATGKVRSLQTHGASVSSVPAGQRVAVNLSAISQDQLERGDAVCAKGAFIATNCMNAWLDLLGSAPKSVSHWQRVRLHAGTSDVIARISLLRMDAGKKKSAIQPGNGGPVQILTETKIAVTAGQRFMIRFYSPLVTIGGGRIMLPNAETAKGRLEREAKAKITEELSAGFGPVALLAAIVRDKGILTLSTLSALSQMDKSVFEENANLLSAAPETCGLREFGGSRNFISAAAFATVERSVLRMLREFHTKYPERAGIDAENLHTALDSVRGADKITSGDFKELLGLIAAGKSIAPVAAAQGRTCYRAAEHSQTLDRKLTELAARIKEESAAAGFNLIKLSELEEKLNAAPASLGAVSPAYMKRAMKYLQENENLRVLDGGLLFPRATQERLLASLAAMDGDITVANLRDRIGVNRKHSLAMLDFLDTQGITRREGDKRFLTL
ncbi:MAG: selenocysteine-specific translation elongation factor [Spirochaetaceae bacterium]|jgi:selenocysteine-specific elongation factor|nr:selenocysteine-specific translation elongation factor [Spirochaetaceae bacterium]